MQDMNPLEIEHIHANISKLIAESMKLQAEALKMNRERAWYPAVLMITALGAGAAIAKFFA